MARRGALPSSDPFDQRYRTGFTKVRGSVVRFCGDESDDVVQEAYERAIRRRVPGDLEPWLRTVARRIAVDNARRRREFANGTAADIERLHPRPAASPEEIVVCNENVGLIRKALRSLPARYREALVVYSEQRDNHAVAQQLGVSANAAGSLLCRARSRLREELSRVGYAASVVVMKLHDLHGAAATATAAVCVVAAGVAGIAPVRPPAAPSSSLQAVSAVAGRAAVTPRIDVKHAATAEARDGSNDRSGGNAPHVLRLSALRPPTTLAPWALSFKNSAARRLATRSVSATLPNE